MALAAALSAVAAALLTTDADAENEYDMRCSCAIDVFACGSKRPASTRKPGAAVNSAVGCCALTRIA